MVSELNIPENAYTYEIQPRWRDTDALNHVNHVVFLTYLETARVDWIFSYPKDHLIRKVPLIMARIEMDYKLPIKLGDSPVVSMWISRIGGKSFTFDYLIYDKNSQVVFGRAKTILVYYDYDNECSREIPVELKKILENMLYSVDN